MTYQAYKSNKAPVVRMLAALLASALVASCMAFGLSQEAYADSDVPFVSGSTSKAVRVAKSITAKEKKAYKRALKMCMDYKNQPNPIVVDVSDLGLTRAQALHVGYLLHGNGELFWINTYNDDSFKKKKFSIPCYYSDDEITARRAALEVEIKKAMGCITSGMSQSLKVHALHDYILDHMTYQAAAKTSYDGLVNGVGDCFGFARTTDLLLRRAGFTVDMAFRNDGEHSWNLVKVDGKWYHVDTTWDNGWGENPDYTWAKHNLRCHLDLLQPDSIFAKDDHKGWWAHHKCTSKKYVNMRYADTYNSFDKRCYEHKIFTSGFKSKGLKYKACGDMKVKLVDVRSSSKRNAKVLNVPAKVKYKGKYYKVVGIGSSALANAKAKILKVASPNFSSSRVKGSLTGSSVSKVKLLSSAKSKKAAYKKYFAKKNSGKKVKVS